MDTRPQRQQDKFRRIYGEFGVVTIKDSLNREVNIAYNLYDSASNRYYDEITYQGFNGMNGTARRIRVWYRNLEECLRQPSFPPPAKTREFLFPPLDASDTTPYNPRVVSEVELPDGRQYQLKYNWWGELARVDLPTGGHIEYDYAAGVTGGGVEDTGVISSTLGGDLKKHIYRRVIERRVYKDAGTTPEVKETYSRPENNSGGNEGFVEVQHIAADATVLARERHYFYFGSPKASFFKEPHEFSKWQDGKESKTEFYEKGSSGLNGLLRTVENTWNQRTLSGWWGTNSEDANAPPIDTRLTKVETTLNDVTPAQLSKQESAYDDYNNKTEVRDFDFGSSTPTRKTQTDYQTSGYDTVVGGNSNPDPTATIHIRDLPAQQRVRDGGGTLRAKTAFEYDNYNQAGSDAFHAPLINRSSITGLDSAYTSTHYTRGNATKTTHYLLDTSGGETGSISSYAQYDIAGNVVRAIDPRSTTSNIIATAFDFDDRYGVPNDDEAQSNTRPSEVPSPFQTYAFATKVTSPAPFNHTVYTQYDYYLGKAVNGEDANGIVAKGSYDDLLDRGTELVTGIFGGSQLRRRTKFTYDDVANTITTQSDQTTLNDDAFKAVSFYDGLGLTFETRSYETTSAFITTKQEFDGLGRVTRSYNPFRTTSDETYGYTDTVYDGLGRVTSVTTPDGAVVGTAYDGPRVLVTDQAGKQRISKTDGVGRLTDVWEIRSADSATGTESVTFPNHAEVTAGYRTKYSYDALDDLAQVTQQIGTAGSTQSRYFMYDSLKRLIRARNPEQDTNSSIALTDPLTGNNQWSMKYTYDNNSNLETKTDARGTGGITASFEYDNLNRVTSRVYANDPQMTPAVSFKYDGQTLPPGAPPSFDRGFSTGRLVAVTYGGTSAGHYTGYDQVGRVNVSFQQTDSQNYRFHYGYNLASQMTSEKYPSDKEIRTTYDVAGRVNDVKRYINGVLDKTYASQFSYAAHGAVAAMQLGNSKWEHTSFNNRLQPTLIGLGTSSADSSILRLDYGYGSTNNNGNVLTQTMSAPGLTLNQCYGYDSLNRLSTAGERSGGTNCTGTQQWKQAFIYDRYGNRNFDVANTTGNVLGPNPTISPATNRFTAGQNYGYDSIGNLTSEPATNANGIVYDAENRQTQYTKSGQATNFYYYDGDGHRVKKIDGAGTTVFVYNAGGQLIAEYHNDPVPPAAGGGGTSYLTIDHLGSTRVVTNSSGTVKARYDYLPFGEQLGSGIGGRTVGMGYSAADSTRQKFTQKERDNESGLDYFLARYYSSAQGRFTSPDPLYIEMRRMGDPQQLNLYSYTRNNPLKYVDDDGLEIRITGDNQQIIDETVADLNKRKGVQFQTDVKDGKLHVVGQVDASKLSKSERAFYDAIVDTKNTAEIKVVRFSDAITFGQSALVGAPGRPTQAGLNIVDRADLNQLRKAGSQVAGEAIAHEALEAYVSVKEGLNTVGAAHARANQFFGDVRTTSPEALPAGAAMATGGRQVYNFNRIGVKATVEKVFITPQPAADVGKNWDRIRSNVRVIPPK